MAIRKSLVKVFIGRQKKISPLNKKCKVCNIKYIGNKDKFYRKMQNLCLECYSKKNKEKQKKIKKLNIC